MLEGVIIYGAPGSGKGTQAKLLSEKFNLYHFNSGDYIRKIIYDPKSQDDPVIKKERELNEAGKLNTEEWVMGIINKRFSELMALGQSIVSEGYPRTLLETFGNEKHQGAVKIFEKGYGKESIFIFVLNIPEEESIRRNQNRATCSVCKTAFMNAGGTPLKTCPICGGEIIHRVDDNPETIKIRLVEYKERTKPIFDELKKQGYKVFEIDGTPLPYKIHEQVVEFFSR